MQQVKKSDLNATHLKSLRLSGVEKQSIVDGPGLRYVVFTQGCPHKCHGCHNPQTHDFSAGYEESADTLLAEFDANPLLKGMTLSGGEPFSQATALLPLARGMRSRNKDLYCFSGYTFEELLGMSRKEPAIQELLSLTDVLIDGRFILSQRDLTLRFRGSANQRILDAKASLAAGKAIEAVLPD